MAYEIVAVRINGYFADSTDKITHVKLSDGTVESVSQVVSYIDSGMDYFYTESYYSRAQVESVHPTYGSAYIRTKRNSTGADNLLNLPKF
jgi:hypothetical protein